MASIEISKTIDEIVTKAREEYDRFVFETIAPYCEEVAKMEITKADLEEALTVWKSFKEGALERKTFPKFRVIDNKTGKEPDLRDIALNEKWAFRMIHCGMKGFAITDEGDLLMIDECGQYEECYEGRFTVVMEGAEE